MNNRNGRRHSEQKARRNGFFLSLAICLVAVGIAAWSTYDAVKDYMEPATTTNQSNLESQKEQEIKEGQAIQGKSSSQQAAPSVTTPQPEQEVAAQVEAKATPVPTPKVTEAPKKADPAEEPVDAPVENSGVLYEVSTEPIYPVSAKDILLAYSEGKPVYSQTMKDWRIHAGMDIKTQANEAVLACGNGQVKSITTDRLLGNVVEIEHGNAVYYYCGLGEDTQVQEGDIVSMGQQIGTIAAVPFESAEEPHLHLEVKSDGAYLNPATILGTN